MQRPHPKNAPRVVTVDVVTGVEFVSTTENHYERNDGVPVAPHVSLPKKSLRERVEDLMYRGGGVLPALRHDGSDESDFEIEDGEENDPMTSAELRYVYTEEERVASEAQAAAQRAAASNPPPEGQNAPATSGAPAAAPTTPPPSPPPTT